MHDEQPPIAATILRRLTVLTVATAVLGVAVIAVGAFAIASAIDAADRATTANTALCTLRADFRDRVRRTDDFIRAHPHGALGYTPVQLMVQLRQQRRTVESLRSLACPPDPPVVP